ncbi:TonB-dependent receptor family protein [Terriglobus roseus DSM 18391]|uniref:TonB-dependent receptor family protein n=1 Tax=Terriglobus roseus (strain DSM 18391 / NRRL B-41598 / KBS 63) TaxID=926566 RepID=I3ZLJ5_TERRK|nr:carboxypeptidase regulatory-like domain-containing protein [Terriglobus roseus]AFL90113.1 TonB-dependent receptor family protein [Terriglobus roseus DSM 18391]
MNDSRRLWCAVALASPLALISVCAHAQSSFGQISGVVADQTGAAIPNATISITSITTQSTRTATTDSDGNYIVTNLPIGEYVIAVKQAGFRTAQQSNVTITADAKVTSNFAMQMGQVSEVVEVQGGAIETLNTTSGELSRVIDAKQVENLALNGRNYTQLLTLVPGAVVTNPDIFAVTTSLASNNQTINGNRSDSNNLTVDGAYNQVAGSNGSLMNNVGPDFISEVKINTSNSSAEYGRTQGPTFNIVTKSGSNAFHGGAFEFHRNSYLDATNYIARKKTQLIYNDFGFFLGGPIIRDKLFFFVGEEWKRLRQQATASTFTVPTTAMLNGDFSSLCSAAKDGSGNPGSFNGAGVCSAASGTFGQLYYPGTSTPIPNNNISSLMTPDGKAIANVYKTIIAGGLSYRDGGIPSNNLTLAPSNPLDFHQDLVRIDYVINQQHSLFARWIHDQNTLIDPYGTFSNGGILNTTPTTRNRPGQSYLISETWSIRQNLINQVQANASWAAQRIPPYGNNWKRETYGFGFNKLYPGVGPYPNGIPITNISNYAGFQGPNFSLISPSTDIQIADNITYVKGDHNMKFGIAYIRDRVDQNGRSNYTGTVGFSQNGTATARSSNCGQAAFNTTCYSLSDAFLGNFQSYSENSADPVGHFRFNQIEGYVQDQWRVTRRLSLDLGMRYQWLQPFYAQGNNLTNFDPAAYNAANAVSVTAGGSLANPGAGNPYNGLVRVGDGVPEDQQKRVTNVNSSIFGLIPSGAPRGFYKMNGAVGPRFGFAYAANDKTSIRGGAGLFYYRPQGNLVFSQLNLPPFLQNTQFGVGNLATLGSLSANSTGLQAGISAVDPKNKTPYTWQYSVGVQRQLPGKVLLEASYVGSVAHHQLRQPNINIPDLTPVFANQNSATPNSSIAAFNPYKGFNAINSNRFDSNYNYNALQVFASKRSGAITATLSYTYSKALGDSAGNNITLENWRDLAYNYGPLSNDRRHAFVASFTIQAPELKGRNFLLREIAGGWQLSGVARLQSGAYYTIQQTSTIQLGTTRADFVAGQGRVYNAHAGICGYLNNGAGGVCNDSAKPYVTTPKAQANHYGNAPVGGVVGPGLAQTDATLSKTFPFGEIARLKLQADMFNVLNRTNFNGINLNTSSSNFGTISSAFPPRQMQLGARILF